METVLKGQSQSDSKLDCSLLGLEVQVDGEGRLQAQATGLMGPLLQPLVKEVFGKMNSTKVLARQNGANVFTLYQPAVPSRPSMKGLANKLFTMVSKKPRPSTATLAITHYCQAACDHCSADRYMERGRHEEHLDTDTLKRVIRQTEDLGATNIVLTGGEPLLRKDIYELVEFVDRDEANCMMFTNGLLLTEKNVQRLADAGLYALNISLDSPQPEEHDRLRHVPGCWEKAVEGAHRCVEKGILTGISTYVTHPDIRAGKAEAMLELAKSLGLHEITIFDCVPTGKLLHGAEEWLLTPEDKQHLIDLYYRYYQDPEYPGIVVQSYINGPLGIGCLAGYFQFYMTASGEFCPCDFTPLSFGNVREESVQSLWAKMISHEAYRSRCEQCRMQLSDFRARYIDVIPDGAPLPFPVDQLPKAPVTVAAGLDWAAVGGR